MANKTIDFKNREQDGRATLLYYLDETEQVDDFVKNMIEHNDVKGVLRFSYLQKDLNRVFSYDVTGKVTLSNFFSSPVTKTDMSNVFVGMADALSELDDYMISSDKVLLDSDKIYYDPNSKEVGMIILPVDGIQETQKFEDYIKQLLFSVRFQNSTDGAIVGTVLNYLNSGQKFTYKEFKKVLSQKKDPVPQQSPRVETHNTIQGNMGTNPQPIQPNVSATGQPAPQTMQGAMMSQENVIPTPVQSEPKKKGLFGGKEKAPKQPKEKKVKEKKPLYGKKETQPAELPKLNISGGNVGFRVPGQDDDYMAVAPSTQSKQTPQMTESKSTGSKLFGRKQDEPAVQIAPVAPAVPAPNTENRLVNADFGKTVFLDDDAEPVGPAVQAMAGAPIAYLMRRQDGVRFDIATNYYRIGREKGTTDLTIEGNKSVGRSHAQIIADNGNFYIRDDNSLNHTFLNGQQIESGVMIPLPNGSQLRFANVEFQFWIL